MFRVDHEMAILSIIHQIGTSENFDLFCLCFYLVFRLFSWSWSMSHNSNRTPNHVDLGCSLWPITNHNPNYLKLGLQGRQFGLEGRQFGRRS
jgi:hypothetical protein